MSQELQTASAEYQYAKVFAFVSTRVATTVSLCTGQATVSFEIVIAGEVVSIVIFIDGSTYQVIEFPAASRKVSPVISNAQFCQVKIV